MTERQAELRAYYEEEAHQRLRKPLVGRRVELRTGFIELLAAEQRTSVVDFGAGPGGDAEGFVPAGVRYVGVDLAHGNGVLAAGQGVTVVQGSIIDPPLRPHSFDAGWSMSTLMHLTAAEASVAVERMALILEPGSPLLIGVWGGEGQEENGSLLEGIGRQFSLRSVDQNEAIFSAAGTIEHAERWEVNHEGWHYQIFRLRTDAG